MRQKKIADAAERLFSETGQLRWHILHPVRPGPAALREAKAEWLRAANPPGAIWTIEQSRKTGALHCNIITPADITATITSAHQWNQTIVGDPRAVGAYIGKQRQMPTTAAYDGRLWGTAGPMWQLLTTQKISPAVAAAAAQYVINSHAAIDRAAWLELNESEQNKRKWIEQDREAAAAAQPSREESRAIAAKWLPDLLEWREKNRQKTSIELEHEFMKREGSI